MASSAKDILIIANFCRDFSATDNGRFMYLCKALSDAGHNVEIVTSDFNHMKKEHKPPLETAWPFKITFLHEPGYRKNVSIRRLMSHKAWGEQVKAYLRQRKQPDVIYCAVPSLTAALGAGKYCEKNKVRFIIDIQDLWPEAFKLALNIPVLSDLLFLPLTIVANGIYSRANEVCAVSKTYADRAMRSNANCKDPHVVFLGTNLKTFDMNAAANPVVKPDGELWLGYCGTLGASYDITVVIEALSQLKEQGVKPPKFIIMGDGERREEFESLASSRKVDAFFTGRLPYDQMCGMLKACDIAVNPIMHGAAQSIINKHADYASAGIPVLNTQDCQEYCELVDGYAMGFSCRNGRSEDLAKYLKLLIGDAELRKKMGANARKCSEEKFDRQKTYQELIDAIVMDDHETCCNDMRDR